jgi:hypothetical protein
MPIVEYFHRTIAAEKAGKLPEGTPEKAGKLPEWASFTAVVTGISVFAFATSSFYVFGLASALREPLAIYFSPTDYLRITPLWAIPTLGFAALMFAVYGFVPTMALRSSWLAKRAAKFRLKTRFLLAGCASLLLGVATFFVTLLLATEHSRVTFNVVVLSATLSTVLYAGARYVPVGKGVKVLIVTATWAMAFALLLGNFLAHFDIEEAPLSRIVFESEKDQVAAVEGKVIFDLDRYFLLLTQSKSVVAIPHEKIKSIQTPPIRESKENSAGD